MDTRRCNYFQCPEGPRLLKRQKTGGYYLDALWFCSEACVQQQATHTLERLFNIEEPLPGFITRPKMSLFLLNDGAITRAQLELATQAMQRTQRGTLAWWLLKLGYTTEREITKALCRQFGLPFVDLTHAQIGKAILDLLPAPLVASGRVFPLDYNVDKKEIALAFGGHVELSVTRVIAKMLECSIASFIGDESHVLDIIGRHYGVPLAPFQPPPPKSWAENFDPTKMAELITEGARQFGTNEFLFEAYNHLLWIRYVTPVQSESIMIDMSQGLVVAGYKVG